MPSLHFHPSRGSQHNGQAHICISFSSSFSSSSSQKTQDPRKRTTHSSAIPEPFRVGTQRGRCLVLRQPVELPVHLVQGVPEALPLVEVGPEPPRERIPARLVVPPRCVQVARVLRRAVDYYFDLDLVVVVLYLSLMLLFVSSCCVPCFVLRGNYSASAADIAERRTAALIISVSFSAILVPEPRCVLGQRDEDLLSRGHVKLCRVVTLCHTLCCCCC